MTKGMSFFWILSQPPKRVAKAVAPLIFRKSLRSSIVAPSLNVAGPAVDRYPPASVALEAPPHAELQPLDGGSRLVHPGVAGEAGDLAVRHHPEVREIDEVGELRYPVPGDRLLLVPVSGHLFHFRAVGRDRAVAHHALFHGRDDGILRRVRGGVAEPAVQLVAGDVDLVGEGDRLRDRFRNRGGAGAEVDDQRQETDDQRRESALPSHRTPSSRWR